MKTQNCVRCGAPTDTAFRCTKGCGGVMIETVVVPRNAVVFALGVLDSRLEQNDGTHPDFDLAESYSEALHAALSPPPQKELKCACREPNPERDPICDEYKPVGGAFTGEGWCQDCSHDCDCHKRVQNVN